MWRQVLNRFKSLTGTRRFAAGAFALYVVGWLAERALTLFWEKFLELQAPVALKNLSELLATDLATGMALMALLVLFVPPMAQWIFEASASFTRFLELRSKRLSQREYLAAIAAEAIELAKEARAISVFGRWDYEDLTLAKLGGAEAWDLREKRRGEMAQQQSQAMQNFVVAKLGRASFLQREFVKYGFSREVPRVFEHITNLFCLAEMASALEEAANSARAELVRDGYLPDETLIANA
jgi:hypothetical protein